VSTTASTKSERLLAALEAFRILSFSKRGFLAKVLSFSTFLSGIAQIYSSF
jgi:hypothetical protein